LVSIWGFKIAMTDIARPRHDIRRLFSRVGQAFSRGWARTYFFIKTKKRILFFLKKSNNILFLAGQGQELPLPPYGLPWAQDSGSIATNPAKKCLLNKS
jgi:hypothetical protein